MKFRRDDVEFVVGPGIDKLEPDAIQRVGNMLTALHSIENRMDKIEGECSDDDRADDRSSTGHAKEAQKLEEAAREAAASGDEKLAAAFRMKAQFHHEELGRKDKDIKSPVSGTKGQPASPRRPGTSPLSR
jgi:hypothetical protein